MKAEELDPSIYQEICEILNQEIRVYRDSEGKNYVEMPEEGREPHLILVTEDVKRKLANEIKVALDLKDLPSLSYITKWLANADYIRIRRADSWWIIPKRMWQRWIRIWFRWLWPILKWFFKVILIPMFIAFFTGFGLEAGATFFKALSSLLGGRGSFSTLFTKLF